MPHACGRYRGVRLSRGRGWRPVFRYCDDDASLEDRICVAMSAEMVAAYVARDFKKCIEVTEQMDKQFGTTKLATLYRKTSQEYLENPPGPDFAGNLILTEK